MAPESSSSSSMLSPAPQSTTRTTATTTSATSAATAGKSKGTYCNDHSHDEAGTTTCTSEAAPALTRTNNDTFSSTSSSSSSSSEQQQQQQQQQQTHHRERERTRTLRAIPLTVIVFYSVSGGPFGVEQAVRSAGNLVTLVGFIVMPFIWSLQEALMTAELASAFSQDSSGGVVWVEQAFQSTLVGWMAGYLSWIGGATDNAIYPVLFLEYLIQALSSDPNNNDDNDNDDDVLSHRPLVRFILLSLTSILLAYINWLGLDLVSQMSLSICCVAMSPFFILCIVGAFQVDPHQWLKLPDAAAAAQQQADNDDDDTYNLAGGLLADATFAGVLWRPFLNNLFWNLNSFDSAAYFASDVQDPGRVLPLVLKWSVAIVALGYIVPLLVALGATPDSVAVQADWVDGYLARVATNVVGPWLGGWTVLAAGISNIALFQAELSSDAFQLMGMADRGYLPAIFTQRSRHGTPTYGILVGTMVIVVLSVSHLDTLIEMLNFNYAIALLMEYCAFFKLRMSKPELHRPYRIPLNTIGCCFFFFPTVTFTILVMTLATYRTLAFSVLVNIIGLTLYWKKATTMATPGHGPCLCSWWRCCCSCCQKTRYNRVDSVDELEVERINNNTTDGCSNAASESSSNSHNDSPLL